MVTKYATWLLCSLSTVVLIHSSALAQAEKAVVRIPSHGISGTIVYSGPGVTDIVSCAHGHDGRNKAKPMKLDIYGNGEQKAVEIKLMAIDERNDLTWIRLFDGPLPYVCPVAPKGHRLGAQCRSIGFDEMKFPVTDRPATPYNHAAFTDTRERPWHGRSGGALVDGKYLVGVCHGYAGPPNHVEVMRGGFGIYVNHATVVSFLERNGWQFPNTGVQEQRPPMQHLTQPGVGKPAQPEQRGSRPPLFRPQAPQRQSPGGC